MTSGPISAYLEAKPSTPYQVVTRAGAQSVQTYQDQGYVGHQGAQGPNIPLRGFTSAIKNPMPSGGVLNAAWSATNGTRAAAYRGFPANGGDWDYSSIDKTGVFDASGECITLTATAANAELKQTTTWPSGVFRVRAVWFVHNRAAAARSFQPTIDAVNSGSAVSIPAGQFMIVRSDVSSSSASQRVLGLKVTNSANTEQYDIWELAAPALASGTPQAPTPAYIYERNKDGVSNPVVGPGFVGTAFDSNFVQDPSFWMIPLTPEIFDAEQGEIVVDAAALWPFGSSSTHPLFAIGSKALMEANAGTWYLDNWYALLNPGGASGVIFRHISSSGMTQETVNANPAISAANAKDRHTYFVSWDPARWGASIDAASMVYNKRISVDDAWPFNAPLVPDPVLHIGTTANYPVGATLTAQCWRMALCTRPLTPAERAYLIDPTSVYSINMLAVPNGANLSDPMTNWIRGDTQSIDIEIIDSEGTPVSLSGTSIWLTIKPEGTDLDTDTDATLKAYITISNTGTVTGSNLMTLIDADTGRLRFAIGTSESDDFDAAVRYKWDIQGKSVSGDIRTCRQGQLTIQAEVTRRITTP